ncbi:MAG: rhodanese-like domain-containing protein [Desulfurivibrionaceae bacterium]
MEPRLSGMTGLLYRGLAFIIPLFILLTPIGCSREEAAGDNPPAKAVTRSASQNNVGAALAGQTGREEKIFRSISPAEAKKMMESRKDMMMVDLREAGELREGYIAGSRLIPMSALAKGSEVLPADKALLLICAVGGRSYGVGRYFSAKGYPEIYNLKGGISAWKKAGLALKY